MEKSIVATGKSIDLAIAAALEQLGMDRDSVSVEVLENAKTGFLGIGACPAKVKVTFEVPDEIPVAAPAARTEPAPALSSASRKPKKQAPRLEKKPEAPQQEKKTAPKPEQKPVSVRPNREKTRREASEQPKAPVTYAPAKEGTMEAQVETFLKGLLAHMGSDAVPHAFRKDDDTVGVELTGENLGILIGHRGETLDAIQHLTNYAVNRGESKRTRVSIDAENYRAKREESLQRLAKKVAGKVVKYNRNMTLEPMNAYERHVIHATLQDVPNVTTFSTGVEPNRRVVVAYNRNRED